MEAVRSKWLLAAGTGVTGGVGEGGGRCPASRVLHLRPPSGIHHGGFSPIFFWRRGALTIVPTLPRCPPTFSAFPSTEKPETADVVAEVPEVQTPTARELATEATAAADETQNPTDENELIVVMPMAAVETDKAHVVQPQTPKEALEAGAAGTGATQVQPHTSTEPMQVYNAEITKSSTEVAEITKSSTEVETTQTEGEQAPITVPVKFMLHKSCKFGEQFLLVGEDPALGLWDPANAIPLEWSDGHVWVSEVNLPVGKEIKFKFILRVLSGKIKWQPGPDRVLQTCETTDGTIVVVGDWDSAVDQQVTDKGPVADICGENNITTATTDGETVVIERKQTPTTDGNQYQTTGEVKEDKPLAHQGDPVLIPGFADQLPKSKPEGASSEDVLDGASLASGGSRSNIAEVALGE